MFQIYFRFQPRNRVSHIILKINTKILERNPVSQPTG